MEERLDSWVPHLLGFILPIITIAGLYQGGWWTFSGFVWALGIGPILDYFSPEGIPKRGDGFSTRPWNLLLFGHSLAAIAAICMLFYRTHLDGLVLTTILGALSVGIVSGIS